MEGGITPVRNVSSKELSDWRKKVRLRAGGRAPSRARYGASRGLASRVAPTVDSTPEGNADLAVEAVGPRRQGRDLANIMEQRRQEQLARLEAKTPEAKLEMVRLLRRSNPGMFGGIKDDAEAVTHLNRLIREESEAIAKRALIRDARDHTLIYGGGNG